MTGAPKGTGSLAGSTASSRAPRLRKPISSSGPWPWRRKSRRAGQPSAGNARTRHAQAKPDVTAVQPGTTKIGGGGRPKRRPKLKTRTPPQNGRDNGKGEHLIAAPHPQPAPCLPPRTAIGSCGPSAPTWSPTTTRGSTYSRWTWPRWPRDLPTGSPSAGCWTPSIRLRAARDWVQKLSIHIAFIIPCILVPFSSEGLCCAKPAPHSRRNTC